MKALFLDFEDSFSFNVVQELSEAGFSVEVMLWKDFNPLYEADLLVLGPGPGHPDEYQKILPFIQQWLDAGKKILGICLGHQILWQMRGAEVSRSLYPLHGQKIQLNLNQEWRDWLNLQDEIWVQRYNSLCIDREVSAPHVINHLENGEVFMSRSPQTISYQFHPESVGTNCRSAFFNVIFSHLL